MVVECDLCELLTSAPAFGRRSKQHNAKTLLRSILAYQADYRVPWLFAGSRRMAEVATFEMTGAAAVVKVLSPDTPVTPSACVEMTR